MGSTGHALSFGTGTARGGVRPRAMRLVALLTVILVVVAGLLLPSSAQAAGDGVLTVSVEPVDSVSGAPQTQVAYGTNQNSVAYKVAVSCSVADCVNAQVKFSPSQADPYGLAAKLPATDAGRTLLLYRTWTNPSKTGNPTGTDATGKTFPIGTLTAGESLSFTVTYGIASDAPERTLKPGQFYPNGFQIVMSATASSSSASADVSATASPVTWRQQLSKPEVRIAAPTSSVQPNQTVSITGAMTTGSLIKTGVVANGQSRWAAAGYYEVVMQLPPEAEIAGPIPDFGTYDPATQTVRWVRGDVNNPSLPAAGGWGLVPATGWYSFGGYEPHSIPVRFPGTKFSPTGCDFSATVPVSMSTTVSYLDDKRTTQTAEHSINLTVACQSPFPGSSFSKTASRFEGGRSDTGSVIVPQPGSNVAGQYSWITTARNESNVAGVATVTDDTLDQPDAPVFEVEASNASTFSWTLSDGTTGTRANVTKITAPNGTRFAKVTAVSGTLQPGRVKPTDKTSTDYLVTYRFAVNSSAPVGQTRSNSATSTMTWPSQADNPAFVPQTKPANASFQFVGSKPRITAAFTSDAQVAGGGQAVPGSEVTYRIGGATNNVPTGSAFTPEYVFIAPTGWNIKPGSAAFAGSVPPGVKLTTATRTFREGGNDVSREVLVASWPAGTTFGSVANLPVLSVVALPGPMVKGGTQSVATARIGDSARLWNNTQADWMNGNTNFDNADGTGDTGAWFSGVTQTVQVGSTDRLSAKKEICVPDAGAPDGCNWAAVPGQTVGVGLKTTDIKYRVTLQNAGNTQLTNVVAYDVLPFVGDTGFIPATQGISRGSGFDLTLESVAETSANLRLSYTAATNPSRPEVSPDGKVNDWGAGAAGKRGIRAQVTGALAPGASASFTYVAGVADNAGVNALACNSVALVSAQTPAAEPLPVCAQLRTNPRLSLVKTADLSGVSKTAKAGQSIAYAFEVTNTGDVPMTQVAVADALPGLSALTYTWPAEAGVLAPGQVAKAHASYVLTQADVDAGTVHNSATVSGADPGGVRVDSPASTVDSVITGSATISLVKSASRATVSRAGDVITYSLVATNTGTTTLSEVSVKDLVPGVDVVSTVWPTGTPAGVLAPGAAVVVTATYKVTQADIDRGVIENQATSSALSPRGVKVDDASQTTVSVTGGAALTIVKSASPSDEAGYVLGQKITYSFVVTNTGNKTVSTPVVTETAFDGSGALALDCAGLPAVLAPGAQGTCTATYELTQEDIDRGATTNTARVSGIDPTGSTVVSADSTVRIPGVAAPSVALVKTADRAVVNAAGDVVTYAFAVTNTGTVTLHDVAVADVLPGLSDVTYQWPGEAGILLPGQVVTATATYAATQADLDAGSFTNMAQVMGIDPHGTQVSDSSSVSVSATQTSGLTLKKTADLSGVESPARAGQSIVYAFELTNSGNVTVRDAAVTDALPGLSELAYDWPGDAGVLAPGQTVVARATYVLTQADVDAGVVHNSATAAGTDPNGTAVESPVSTVESPIVGAAGITLEKTSAARNVHVGDTVRFDFVVTNSGTLTLSEAAIADPMAGLSELQVTWPGEAGVLAPGESAQAHASYVVTAADLKAGGVTNTATASALPAGESTAITSEESSVTITVVAVPVIPANPTDPTGTPTGPTDPAPSTPVAPAASGPKSSANSHLAITGAEWVPAVSTLSWIILLLGALLVFGRRRRA
ncbi:DUF11 domain-containing protein [Mycetocola sp. JXN-3]|uniref:DUF7507 domain-containing protein n=1 Tax=Mycetocola sp. JXN-3 TaxID=2116510 RepID=UPI00165D2655|nr:DUF11 domain-containing protein [Mycetocola sp. JXN-3]